MFVLVRVGGWGLGQFGMPNCPTQTLTSQSFPESYMRARGACINQEMPLGLCADRDNPIHDREEPIVAHAIETHDGVSFAAFRNTPAWHKLGVVFNERLSTKGMLDAAHLSNWDVRLEPADIPADYKSVAPFFRVVRTNPVTAQNEILAYVGKKYRTYQNEQLFDFGDNLLDLSLIHI